MNDEQLGLWICASRIQGLSPKYFSRLLSIRKSIESVFSSSATDFLDAGIAPDVANKILKQLQTIEPSKEVEQCRRYDIDIIPLTDERYPESLKTIFDPPIVLFSRGSLPSTDLFHLAVVGSRKATVYGHTALDRIVSPLVNSGVVVVSGLAYGIDSLAHKISVDAQSPTIAVLATGLDDQSMYPSKHRSLAHQILETRGTLISEYPIGTPALKHHFIARNRIIAGLSHATLVVEAAEKSGSLITARFALEGGKDVYAVPGPIQSDTSKGTNSLIKTGAIPVTEPSDILDIQEPDHQIFVPSSDQEASVYHALSPSPLHAQEIIRASDLAPEQVLSILSLLEMKGVVTSHGGSFFSRKT